MNILKTASPTDSVFGKSVVNNMKKVVLVGALLCAPVTANAMVISVDFETTVPGLASGVEATAASVNAAFGSANVWNGLACQFSVCTFSNHALVDSTGAATSVTFSGVFNGAFDFTDTSTTELAVRTSYAYWGGLFNDPELAEWKIGGLTPGAAYSYYGYAAKSDIVGRQFDHLADADGDGSLTDETAQTVTDPSTDAYYAKLIANANGEILFSGLVLDAPVDFDEGNLAGFQIAAVPLPAAFPLLAGGLGLFGLMGWRRKYKVVSAP